MRRTYGLTAVAVKQHSADPLMEGEMAKPIKSTMQELANRFGGCGCKDRCEMEQFGEAGVDRKPRGRLSVCEVDAEILGLKMPKQENGESDD